MTGNIIRNYIITESAQHISLAADRKTGRWSNDGHDESDIRFSGARTLA